MYSNKTTKELAKEIEQIGKNIEFIQYIYKKFHNVYVEMVKENKHPNMKKVKEQLRKMEQEKASIPNLRRQGIRRIEEFKKRTKGFKWRYNYHYAINYKKREYAYIGMWLYYIAPMKWEKENQ